MIDRSSRDKTAELLRHLISGQITNFDFEEQLPSSMDAAVKAITSSAWCFYDDFEKHKLKGNKALSKDLKKKLARWIMFLYTDLEYEWPPISAPGLRPLNHSLISRLLGNPAKERKFMIFGEYEVWPFISKKAFLDATKIPRLLAGTRRVSS